MSVPIGLRIVTVSAPGSSGSPPATSGRTTPWASPPQPADVPPGSVVVVTNPDEDCSPQVFHLFLDELLAGPEPEIDSLDAAEALR